MRFLAALGMTTRRLVIEPVEMPSPHFPSHPYSKIVLSLRAQRGIPFITPQTNF
ncbi:MAG: hypothetical protein LBI45_03975 [Bacteroidales bacterium]|nr:hypothetical protein [Bacteroidales bacterium]